MCPHNKLYILKERRDYKNIFFILGQELMINIFFILRLNLATIHFSLWLDSIDSTGIPESLKIKKIPQLSNRIFILK